MNNAKTLFAATALSVVLGFAMGPSVAGEPLDATHFGSQIPTKEALISGLNPAPKTRGISLDPSPQKAVSLEVKFAFDSAQLTDLAKQQLAPLGEALNSQELAGHSFVVEGHTDSVGPDEYNQHLSEQRALAVKNFLSSQYNIDGSRLIPVGKGERELLDTAQPNNHANRRVQIVTR